MFKYVVLALAVACANAAPGAVFASPYVAAPVASAVVTAHSSQVIARNYNGLAAPYITSPYIAAPVAAPLVKAAPYFAASPYVAAPAIVKSAPLIASPALTHYASPFAHYHAAPAYYL